MKCRTALPIWDTAARDRHARIATYRMPTGAGERQAAVRATTGGSRVTRKLRARAALFAIALLHAATALAFGADSLVVKKCASCHVPASDGRMPRIEDVRTTPEEWTVIVDRMRRLHGMTLTRDEMDGLLKELTATQILTPDEQARVAYLSLWHNAQQREVPSGKEEERVFATCVRCHSAGKINSYRMTPGHWAKLRDFHLYAVPSVIAQMREMHWIEEADAVLAYLAHRLPYDKPWSAPAARLAGDWAVFGYRPGFGHYRGEARIDDAGNAEYTLVGRIADDDGTSETFTGEGTLYGGYALRTRTRNNGLPTSGAYIASGDALRGEAHFPAPDFRTSTATWLRKGDEARVARVRPAYLLKGETTTLVVEGVNLPEATIADIAFSSGAVKVLGVRRIAREALELRVASVDDRLVETRLAVKGLDAGVVTLAPRIDRIAVTPAIGRARLSGGRNYPAEGVQFEAIAYTRHGNGRSAKDVALGPVPARFTLAEDKSRDDDDDLRWLGVIHPNGNYVPAGDYGPNPGRRFQGENSGLVKVLAEYRRGTRTYRAQAKLAVTMPDFIPRIR
jgi:quinohemoprotein amine dehydrogenase